MKFRKIEISAFRIYDKVKDATFDFSIDGNETADFVSLFAPNGYGKTSFYDAVEWGMTNNIQRFIQNKNITSSALEALTSQSDEQVKFWRNIHSLRPSFVKIEGEGINPIFRELKPHGNRKFDADMEDGDNLENRTFRKVILSQEWISAFLREIDGTRRYEIFMDNPELKDINNYYKNLKALLSYCQQSITSIDTKIGEEQKRVAALESENILEKINQQIDILTDKFTQPGLNRLTLETSKEEISRLKNLVTDRIITENNETSIREKQEWVSTAKLGNTDYIGIRNFFDLETRNKIIEENQRTLRGILIKFTDADKKTNEITSINKLLAEKEIVRNNIAAVLRQFEEYQRVESLLSVNKRELDILQTNINVKTAELRDVEISEIQIHAELNSALAGITQATTTISRLPERLLRIQTVEKEIVDQEAKIAEETERLRPLENQSKIIEAEIQALANEVTEVNKGVYSKKMIEDPVLALSIDTIFENREALQKINEQLTSLTGRIAQQETLNYEISAFVRQGLEIVNEDRNRSNCPLCEQTFKSHQELADRIAANNALDSLLKGLFADKNLLEQQSVNLQILISTARDRILLYFQDKLKDKRALQTAVIEHVKTLTTSIASLDAYLKIIQNNLREALIEQLGLTSEGYERKLSVDLEAFKQTEQRLNASLLKLRQDKKTLSDLLTNVKDKQKFTLETIATLEKSEIYLSVLAWFRTNLGTDQISFEILQNNLAENERLIKDHFDKVNALRTELESLTLELATLNAQAQKEQLDSLSEEKERADGRMSAYRSLLKDKLEIESQFLDFKTLSATLDLKEQGLKVEQLRNKSLVDEYVKIERYANHINEFLQSENAKKALAQLAADKTYLEENVRTMLLGEQSKTKTFLQEKVKEFFFEDLINDLYRKIDPHPDFKEVRFNADFDSERPRLDVFVRDNINQKVELIPNLYFSTAQINILSLSIFLATALNTPGYDCIFIDDPIQSMDSVNILSTIDLLRSIVLNYKKQIILSTHDETFFNLLKKKMPASTFKSKFMELESVGKVRTDFN